VTDRQARRVRPPDASGTIERNGVRLAYEVFGSGDTTVLLMPTWSIVHSRIWKAQVAYLARHFRVVTFDGRGSGRSGRPRGAAAYTDEEYAADTLAVMDATDTREAVLVALSCGVAWSVHVAAQQPSRVLGLFALSPSCGLSVPQPHRDSHPWGRWTTDHNGWGKYNKHYWLDGDYDDFLAFFFATMFTEPHSTKQIEDCVGWGRDIAAQTLADTTAGRLGCDGAVCTPLEPLCRQVTCPVLVVHGTDDAVRTYQIGERLAELTGGSLTLVDGGGHGLMSRHPVRTNLMIREFVEQVRRPPVERRTWVGSDTPGGTSPSWRSCASSSPTSRSTGWPSIRSRRCWSPPESASTPPPAGWRTSPHTSSTRRASTTCTPFRRSATWTRR
jgi:pimeloyl-ACP methyl ester carboxylesterase